MAPSLLEIAESSVAFVVPPHPSVVEGDGYLAFPRGPGLLAVQRIRLAPDRVDSTRAEIHEVARQRSAERIEWYVSELSEPADLATRLGLGRHETLAALALTSAPEASGAFDIREVRTLDDYITAQKLDSAVNDWPIADDEEYARAWETARERFLVWLALDDGRAVGMARCAVSEHALMMVGGAVLPDARGRGVYRALVEARWASAAARGIPALVTAANDQSAPILRRLGFAELGEIGVYAESV